MLLSVIQGCFTRSGGQWGQRRASRLRGPSTFGRAGGTRGGAGCRRREETGRRAPSPRALHPIPKLACSCPHLSGKADPFQKPVSLRSPRLQWAEGGRNAPPRGKPERGSAQQPEPARTRDSHSGPQTLALAKMRNASFEEPGQANESCRALALGCSNVSSPEPLPLPQALAVAVPVVYAVICAVGLAGNSAVLYVLLRAPRMKSVTNLFILNLAIADELFTLVLPINIADFLLRRWPFGELMCKLIVAIDQYNTFSSLYFLTVMSADRYLVVLATAESRRVAGRTYSAARAVSLAVWGLVTLVVLPFAVFARLDDEHGRRQCVLVFPQPEAFWWRASRLYTLVLGFAIPVSTICVLYTTLLCRLRAIRLDSHAKVLDRAKKRVTFLVVAILAVCLLCWTPYHLSTVVALTTDLPQTPLVIAISYLITSLSYANSCLNPFLYAFLDDSFRRSLRQLMSCRADA
ncbi:neuropeptides B/W receptor type 1 [Heterocephalus glaber]|uniref:Neuropeptides B/W receptor type 1 n=1 Tax=Heterocephalus glaber TaxID=10181 RepID=A0AAX6NV81_HETGA|nr:neuropeptides B/W receptor type 1 [Heterocephalus glaber]